MIYLAQTDTTAGFLSKDFREINLAKNRDENTPCLIEVAKFSTLQSFVRVPNKFKNQIRKSKKTTFIYPNKMSFRVVKASSHADFIASHEWLYSSSANLHNQKFDFNVAKNLADIVVDTEFCEKTPSKIYQISRRRIKKIR